MPPASSATLSPAAARHQSAMIAPRERTEAFDEQQRRRTVTVVPEELRLDLDLWDRPDWPLASPSSTDGLGIMANTKMPQEQAVGGAVVGKPNTFGVPLGGDYGYTFDEHDVSDIEEEDEEDDLDDDVEMMQTPSSLSQSHSHSHSHSHSGSPSQQRRQGSPFHLQPSPSPSASHRAALQALESPQRPSSLPDVSPEREREEQQLPAHSNGTVPSSSSSERVRTYNPEVEGGQQQQHHPQQQHDLPRRQSGVQLRLNGQSTVTEDDDASESRGVVAVPVPNTNANTPRSNNSPVLQQGSRSSFHALPSTNRSSVSKSPMHSPPNRRTSTRSSLYNTTQIPHNKERLRYSWQSLQDDEPNRPRIHIIKLVSNTATASAGFPTGEAFGFSISPGGRRIAAYNSARLFVLQTAALPVGISQDYALKRRPMAVELTDEGTTLAILADTHTVNIYDLGHQLRRLRTIKLDFPTNCIALAPTGGLLAVAYEGGVEIFSLDPKALPTDRRAVRSTKMDRMTFSEDGSTLLGTTTRVNVSSTVVVSAPVFPAAADGTPTHAELKEAWCTELLHPENIRNSSHAVFMRESRTTCNEKVFAWNGSEDTFGLLQVADMHYGNIDFPVVISPPLSTCGGLGAAIHSCPAIDEHGDTVAMIVNDRTIRLYIVPEKQRDEQIPVEAHSIDHELDEGYGCPFSEVRWVHSSASLPSPAGGPPSVKGRLIVTSPGGVNENGISDESVEDIEGGRIILFDFDPQFAGQPGQTFCLRLGKSPPQTLEEEQVDVAEQVALVRRRTVNQNQRGGLSQRPAALGRAATTYGSRMGRGPSTAGMTGGRSTRNSMLSIGTMQSDGARSLPDLMETGEQAEFYEEPYIQGAPRSQASLQRAASNAQRHRYQTIEERNRESISVDSSGNFLALPEYTEEPNAPLPQRFRALAGLDAPATFKGPGKSPDGLSPGSAHSAPHTAPPDVGEHFSADTAFRNANAMRDGPISPTSSAGMRPGTANSFHRTPSPHNAPGSIRSESAATSFYPVLRGGEPYRPASPAVSTRTMDSVNTLHQQQSRTAQYGQPGWLPRGLQRAYSNAVSPLPLSNPANELHSASRGGTVSAMGNYYAGSVQEEEEPWDAISPIAPSGPTSPFGQRVSLMGNPNRFSQQQQQARNASSVSPPVDLPRHHLPHIAHSYMSPVQSDGRRLPPHMLAFRQAAAANAQINSANASLFPPNQPNDHVPLRQPSVRAGTQAHPVTAWHPPAPSTSPTNVPGSSHSGGSAGGKSRKKGLFSKKEKVEVFGKERGGGGDVGAWMPPGSNHKGEKEKCVIM
jgi:hypothetical protein